MKRLNNEEDVLHICTHTASYSYVCIYIYTINTMNITWKKAKAVSKDLKTVLLIETSTQSVSSVSHLHPLRTWSSLLHLITIAGFLLSMLLEVATLWIDVDRWAIFLLSYLLYELIYIDLHSSLDVLVSFSEATVPWRCWCEPDMKRMMDSWELQGCFVARCICRGPRCAQFNQPKVWEAANWCTIFIYFHCIHSLMIRYMQRWKVQVTQTGFRMQDALTWSIWWRAHWEQWQPGKCRKCTHF